LVGQAFCQLEGFADVGELRHIWVRGFMRNEPCGCGRPFRACPFWGRVVGRAYGSFEGTPVARLRSLQERVDRMWRIPQLRSEGEGRFGLEAREYAGVLRELYGAIAEAAGAGVVVDSSKSPSPVYVANAVGGLGFRVLHLVRDSRAVAYSWGRVLIRLQDRSVEMDRYPAVWSALEWDVMNAAAGATRRLGLPYTLVRYEDLVAEPRAVLATSLQQLGFRDADLRFVVRRELVLRPTHSVSGNPSRFVTGSVELRLDREWERRMGTASRLVVTAMTWPLLRAYGYAPGIRASRRRTRRRDSGTDPSGSG
jgi:hypothetical protein